MSYLASGPSSPELVSDQSKSIFPLLPDEVVSSLKAMQINTSEMLQLVTTAGKAGRADDIYVGLASSGLGAWHRDMGDFSQGADYLYNAGLLYGTRLAQEAYSCRAMTDELRLDSPDAFAKAISYLRESYRGLDDSGLDDGTAPNWRRQKSREVLYTGTDVLTMANAGLHDNVLGHLQKSGLPIADEEAFHVGLVDSVLFYDAYAQLRKGFEPKLPDEQFEYIPTYDPRKHVRDPENIISGAARFEFESIDELVANLTDMQGLYKEVSFRVTQDLKTVGGRSVMVQVGPNCFTEMFEVDGIKLMPYRKSSIIVASLVPFVLDVVLNRGVEPLSVLSLSGGAMVAAITAAVRRKERSDAQAHGLRTYA